MKKIEIIIVSIAVIFGTFSVIYAAPSVSPTGGNIARPIHALSGSQWKSGVLNTGELVRRALGINVAPGVNETLAISASSGNSVVVGRIASPDSFTVFANGVEMDMTTICQKTHTYTSPTGGICGGPSPVGSPVNSSDGVVKVNSLANVSISTPATRPLCIKQSVVSGATINQVVICP